MCVYACVYLLCMRTNAWPLHNIHLLLHSSSLKPSCCTHKSVHTHIHVHAQENATSYVLRCNIGSTTNHLNDGIMLGLRDDREKMSDRVGRTCLWKGTSLITRLPMCVCVCVHHGCLARQTHQPLLARGAHGIGELWCIRKVCDNIAATALVQNSLNTGEMQALDSWVRVRDQ